MRDKARYGQRIVLPKSVTEAANEVLTKLLESAPLPGEPQIPPGSARVPQTSSRPPGRPMVPPRPLNERIGEITCEHIFAQMPTRFNKTAAKGLNAVYQFDLQGEAGGKWTVTIADGQCESRQGAAASPNVTISLNAGEYLEMIRREILGKPFTTPGKLQISGDSGLATRLTKLFGGTD